MYQYLLIGDLQISVQNSHSLWFATFFSLNTHIYIPSRIWSLSHGFPVSTTTFFGPLIKLILPQALWWPFERKLHIKIYIKYTVFTKSFQTNMAIRPKVCQLSKYTGPLNNLLAAIYPCVSLNTYIKQITRTYYIFFSVQIITFSWLLVCSSQLKKVAWTSWKLQFCMWYKLAIYIAKIRLLLFWSD